MTRPDKIALIAVFLFSLIFHSTVYYTLFSDHEGFLKYPKFARQYIEGDFERERLLDFSPLYLYAHAIACSFSEHPKEVILWVQFILIALSAVLFYLLLRSFFGMIVASAGTMVFVTSSSLVLYASVFEPEIFLIFFVLSFLLCVLRSSHLMAFLAGLFLGLCLLTRMNLFPLVIITPFYLWLNSERNKRLLQRIILFAVPALSAVLFLSIRNYSVNGTFSPVFMNPGDVFYEGNNPNANGQNVVYPPMVVNIALESDYEADPMHSAYRIFPRRIMQKQLSVSQVNAYWFQKARNFIIDHPWHWCKLSLRKMYLVLHNVRSHDIFPVITNDRKFQKSSVRFLSLPFGLISAMALLGMFLSLTAWRKQFIVYALLLCQISIMVVTYASDRQRVSVLALFIFFAAALLHVITDKNCSARRKAILAAIALGLFPFLYIHDNALKDSIYQQKQFQKWHGAIREAFRNRNEGKLPQASEKIALAHALAPTVVEARMAGLHYAGKTFQERALAIAESLSQQRSNPSVQLDIAMLSIENRSLTKAEAILNELIRKKYRFCGNSAHSRQPLYYLAKIDERKKRTPHAVASLRKALIRNPGDPWALSHLSVLTGDMRCKNKIARYFDEIDAAFLMGQAYLENGLFEKAAESFSYVVDKIPEYRSGLIYLSIALGSKGDYSRATQLYIEAMKKKPEPLFAEQEVITIFRQWATQEYENSQAKFFLGMILKDFGHYDEAFGILQKLVEENTAHEITGVAQEHMQWIEKAKRSYGMTQ